jgi:FdhE protein
MSRVETPQPDPSAIGTIPKPPFSRVPDSVQLFAARAKRFRTLAEGHDLAPYLFFLAQLSEAQAAIQEGLAEPAAIDPDILARAHQHAMPPLDRGNFTADAVFDSTFDRLLSAAGHMDMPPQAAAARDRLRLIDKRLRDEMLQNVLAEAIPIEALAEHVFVAAALQVHYARLAARLDPKKLVSVGDGLCPACGAAPSSTLIVNWPGAEGARYCSCSLCGTLWNHVRSKCTLCGSTRQIVFQEVEGSGGTIKAETCDDCRGYMKVLYQTKNNALEAIADDVATLGLDLLVRELGFRRGAVNPFLIGY